MHWEEKKKKKNPSRVCLHTVVFASFSISFLPPFLSPLIGVVELTWCHAFVKVLIHRCNSAGSLTLITRRSKSRRVDERRKQPRPAVSWIDWICSKGIEPSCVDRSSSDYICKTFAMIRCEQEEYTCNTRFVWVCVCVCVWCYFEILQFIADSVFRCSLLRNEDEEAFLVWMVSEQASRTFLFQITAYR